MCVHPDMYTSMFVCGVRLCICIFISVHACAHAWVYMRVFVCGVCAHVVCPLPCVLMWTRPQDNVKYLALLFFILLFEPGAVSKKLAIVIRAQLGRQKASEIHLFLPTKNGGLGMCSYIWPFSLFFWCLGFKFRSSWLDCRHCSPLSHPSKP